ncbi:MAG: DNA methyltransferase [Bacteroidota bacterium]
MNIAQIENNLQEFLKSFNKDTFIYDLITAYGQPKSTISRLQRGGLNLSKFQDEVAWKKKLFYKTAINEDVHELFTLIRSNVRANKHDPRFLIVTDFITLLALDRKTSDTLDIPILEIAKHFDFFLPWAGMEKAQHQMENPADVRAADRMAKLYDEIKKDNPTHTEQEVHNLNVFLTRLLFCFFAEDTGIFEEGQFTNSIQSHTQQDGSDLNTYLDRLFEVMNTNISSRKGLPAYLSSFPYVNGGLLRNNHSAPTFSRRSRQAIIDSGSLQWKDINPDIFGSMIQAVITPEHRGGLGMHYTSVPNIMKVIKPLFLDELYEEFFAAKGNSKKLFALLYRIYKIKIFDPACGSGNFLIIAYKELRRLEMLVFKELDVIKGNVGLGKIDFQDNSFSKISLGNFYGIELDDFAHEVAILSLWLAEHQMNQEFFKEFGRTKPALPLMETGNIVQGNATRLDWKIVCPKIEGDEIFVLGNPPYKGSSGQKAEQKEDMAIVFKGISGYKNLDFISAWFYKGAKYIQNSNAQYSFVSTNSICQGEQVALLWPLIFNLNLEIDFAYTSFKWKNNAKDNAGVTVIIVCVRNHNQQKAKYLFYENRKHLVKNINPYLAESDNLIVFKRSKMLSKLPGMTYGNKAVYGEPLILRSEEKEWIISENTASSKFIKKFIGAKELLDGVERWVIWLRNEDLQTVMNISSIKKRIESVKKLRLESKEKGANELAQKPHQFRDTFETETNSVIIPLTTSERRHYLPLGFSAKDEILSNAVSVIYNADTWIFGVISSKMHIVWVKAVCGSLETRIRYSNVLGYNTFPFPNITENQKKELEKHVYKLLEEREHHSEKTLSQLYDPDHMPEGLSEAHHQNDLAVERCYRSKPFESDEERLEYLFKLYEQMIADEKKKGTLFEAEKKTKKKKQ